MENLTEAYNTRNFNWVKQDVPLLPSFNDVESVISNVKDVKAELHTLLIDAGREVFSLFCDGCLIEDEDEIYFLVALITKGYGNNYFISRYEVNYVLENVLIKADSLNKIRKYESYLKESIVNKIFNLAVYNFLFNRLSYLRFSSYKIPNFCFSPVSKEEIYLNENDFIKFDRTTIIFEDKSLYDLHDFSHYICVSLSPELYGCKLYSSFIVLDSHLQYLIKNDNLEEKGFTDNFIFRTLSLHLFDYIYETTSIEQEKTLYIAKTLLEFFKGNEIEIVKNGQQIKLKSPSSLSIKELLVLAQNKACEHTASEMEEQLMIRGGISESKNPLLNLDAVSFLNFVNENNNVFYFEERNYVRHRAHKFSYVLYCNYLLESENLSHTEKKLLTDIIDNLNFIDHYRGCRINLNNLIINNKISYGVH